MKELLTAGAFAERCKTTKATLRWYRQTGLLKPAQVGDNGYAYYAAGQVVSFAIIRELQSIGCSLEQIKAYNHYRSLISTDSFLDEQVARLDQRIDELKRQHVMLEQIRNTRIAFVEQWGEHPADGDWHIAHREKECYFVMRAPIVDTSVYQKRLLGFQQICYEIGLGYEAPIAIFFDENSLSKGEFAEGYCIGTKVDDPSAIQEKLAHLDTGALGAPRLVCRDAGSYLAYLATLPLEVDSGNAMDTAGVSPSNNPMIEALNNALGIALREGCALTMGLLATPLSALAQKDGNMRLFFEMSFAAF